MPLKKHAQDWINDLSGQQRKQKNAYPLCHINNPMDFIALISECESIEGLQAITAKLRDYFGFDIVTFGQLATNKQQATGYILACDESPSSNATQWIHYYKRNIFADDPIIKWGRERSTPIIIDDIHQQNKLTPHTTSVLNVMHDFNVSQSLLIPVRATSQHHFVVRLTGLRQKTMSANDLNHHLPLITLICLHLSEAFTRLFSLPADDLEAPKLTTKEIAILSLAASGKNTAAISDSLNISQNTVLYHMKNIHKKLDVRTRQHAIAKALSLGIVSL